MQMLSSHFLVQIQKLVWDFDFLLLFRCYSNNLSKDARLKYTNGDNKEVRRKC